MTGRAAQVRWIASIGAAVLVTDQMSKAIVRATVNPDTPHHDDVFFQWVRHSNPGIVGGMFRDVPLIAYIAPLAALAVLVYLFWHLDAGSRWQATAFGLVLGGAIGNLVDRVRFGGVTDFLQFHFYFVPFDFPWKYFPAFNVADSCIVVGVGLLVITWGRPERKETDVSRPV
jgi:signal peptidase II